MATYVAEFDPDLASRFPMQRSSSAGHSLYSAPRPDPRTNETRQAASFCAIDARDSRRIAKDLEMLRCPHDPYELRDLRIAMAAASAVKARRTSAGSRAKVVHRLRR